MGACGRAFSRKDIHRAEPGKRVLVLGNGTRSELQFHETDQLETSLLLGTLFKRRRVSPVTQPQRGLPARQQVLRKEHAGLQQCSVSVDTDLETISNPE